MWGTNVHISFENGILMLMCTIENMNFVGLYVHISIYKCVHWWPNVHISATIVHIGATNVHISSLSRLVPAQMRLMCTLGYGY